ncbi:MAG: hypothetical protein GX319_03170 [Clostridiales bacterium]|jgi:hypothetical protein|nr:hypothetical protein [Bacillota bacterium]NLK03396.1 hypothetical protein [Clostridiales bacterium]
MELNHSGKQTYIQLLIDSLGKKQEVLSELMQLTRKQESILDMENFDEDEFLSTISLKEDQIKGLSDLDRGFELVYDRIRDELSNNSKEYGEQIAILKSLVTEVTELSVKLQALEKNNRSKLEGSLSNKRKAIRNARLSNETVTNYYKTVSGNQNTQSHFYDKKN